MKGAIPFWIHGALAAAMLIASGTLYRHLEPRWRGTGTGLIKLPVSLSEFPLEIGPWKGQKRDIPATTEIYMRRNFADDYFSHYYVDQQRLAWSGLYVVYCSSRPVGILGHRPGVCFPNAGWIYDRSEESEIITASGQVIPCVIHQLHKPIPDYTEIVVLSFYVVNGTIAVKEDAFSGLMGRNPNISGNPARYVAQVQFSSSVESAVRIAAVDLIDTVLEYLPDKNGYVAAAPDYDPNDRVKNE